MDIGKPHSLCDLLRSPFPMIAAVAIFFAATFIACARESDMILELRDVQFFQAEEVDHSPQTKIKLSGLAFHSSLAVKKVTTVENGDALDVLVHLTPASKGLSGTFAYVVAIPPSVATLRFGKEGSLIWSRSGGVVGQKNP